MLIVLRIDQKGSPPYSKHLTGQSQSNTLAEFNHSKYPTGWSWGCIAPLAPPPGRVFNMARPEKNTVEYFPFLCKEGKAMYYIEQRYKNDGFAAWVKILRQLCVTNYHFLDLSNATEAMFLSAKCGVELVTLRSMISDLCELGEFDKELWNERQVVWCQKLIDSIQDAYLKRKNNCITKEGVKRILEGANPQNSSVNPEKGDGNTQTKLNNTRLDNNKSDKSTSSSSSKKKKKKEEVDNSKEFSKEIEYTYKMILQFFDPKYHPDSTVKIIKWKHEIRRMNELDGLSFEKITEIVRWARRDSFWQKNVFTMMKFRKTNDEGIKYHEVFQERMKGKQLSNIKQGDGQDAEQWFKGKQDESTS